MRLSPKINASRRDRAATSPRFWNSHCFAISAASRNWSGGTSTTLCDARAPERVTIGPCRSSTKDRIPCFSSLEARSRADPAFPEKRECHPSIGPRSLTDRRSAASNSADRIRSCPRSMPPDGNQGQLNRAVDGPLQRLVRRRAAHLDSGASPSTPESQGGKRWMPPRSCGLRAWRRSL
jgi:hypothetical protein